MEIDARLQQIFRDFFNDDELVVTDATTAADVPGWDSLAHVNIMFAIEDEFGISFEGDEFAQFENIGELKQTLAAKAGA